jgi:hypothetical protein
VITERTNGRHTFVATVEGQASVVKGDSLLLLDDANSYWWLVRVLKTEDVGYIPAENIETPYERLARLNKHRNVNIAAATSDELAGAASEKENVEARRVLFAPPTYVEHPGVTWSDESEDEDDGVEWAEDAEVDAEETEDRQSSETASITSSPERPTLDPAQADDSTRRITATPPVAVDAPRDDKKKKKDDKRSRVLGLFRKKDKKGTSASEARSSEDSMVSGEPEPEVDPASTLRQRDQEIQASYQNKYLRPRPNSIILSPNPETPMLNVIRVFAGEHIKSEASFKTVLLNDTTSSSDLVRQAMQRFHIVGSGYYLSVKDVGGEETALEPDEKPLHALQQAVEKWELPTVKRSSVGSISSIASNLSSHPAIAKLGMNDYSDDSNVKLYLHREPGTPPKLAVDINQASPERHFSPSTRFTIQVYAENERKLVNLPRNATVVDAIEQGLERFGIQGVVDGGDDVGGRARYSLCAVVNSTGKLPTNGLTQNEISCPL